MHTNGHTNGYSDSAMHISNPFELFQGVETLRTSTDAAVTIDGHTLSIPSIIAIARHGVPAHLSTDSKVLDRIDGSVAFLESKKHLSIYGVSTGFGGSADTRTGDLGALQVSLLEHQLCGYLPVGASYVEMM